MDLHIRSLRDQGILSVRAYNVCRNAYLNTLLDIHRFYAEKKSFKALRNCGSSTQKELIQILKKFNDQIPYGANSTKIVNNLIQDLNLKKSDEKFCDINHINDTNDLIVQYLFNKKLDIFIQDHLKVKGIKRRLINQCMTILENDTENKYKPSFYVFLNQSKGKLELVFNATERLFNKLRVRSKNVLIDQELDPTSNLQRLAWKSFITRHVLNWPKVGANSADEILLYFERIRSMIHEVYLQDLNPLDLLIKTIEDKHN
jgi:hypothetical protein